MNFANFQPPAREPSIQPLTAPEPINLARSSPARRRQTSKMNVLMVSSRFNLPYRVMRCAEASGANVYVLGNLGSHALRHSRYCKKFILRERAILGDHDKTLAEQINVCAGKYHIDMVLPAGPLPTRTLISIRHLLDVPCFPLPDLPQFDLLNNKWRFAKLCAELAVLCPRSLYFPDRNGLLNVLNRGLLLLPAIAKPLSEDGGHGVVKLELLNARTQIETIHYKPIIVQELIEGEDIGASAFCEHGEIKSFVAHSYGKGTYQTFHDPSIRSAVSRILSRVKADGVYNFDMMRATDGQIYYLECNPRFFYKINLSMAAGLNFVHCGLDPLADMPASVAHGTCVRKPWALALRLHKPWTITSQDLGLLAHLLSDPVPYLRESLRIDWDD
jgi:predicted ATP-grasp superfamily ATP-dependent carboligase